MRKNPSIPESDFQTACQWWDDLPNIWTPLGWKDHLWRFNILWNGTVLARPDMNRRTEPWRGQGLQVAFCSFKHDNNMVRQGWTDDAAPVLWGEWPDGGVLLRSEMFAHVAGGADVERGDEPLFMWMRLHLKECCQALPLEPDQAINLFLQAPHITGNMNMRNNITFDDQAARYPRALKLDAETITPVRGCRLLEPDRRVRLGVAPGRFCKQVSLGSPEEEKTSWHRLHLRLPMKTGVFVDVLLPMIPCDRKAFDRELAIGFDAARSETARFWRRQMKCATRFETPEPEINAIARRSVQFSMNLTEKNPETGKYCKVNGSWVYADLWTTPGAMDLVMLMDTLGHHDAVEPYLDIFHEEQGTVVPPGDAYEAHPGYLSTPARYKSIDWLSDNGAVLWTICRHALLSGNMRFARRFEDCIVKSCDWIKTMRAKTGHGGYEGVLPPAVATDAMTRIQSVWSAGWNYLGLCDAVRVLERLRHPRAAEFAREARDYRRDYVKALRHKCRSMPVWTDARGRKRRFVPTALAGDERAESRHAFYLDTGPLFHVFSGLLPASDPLMRDTLDWFREGPQHRLYRHDGLCWQVPVLDHEMSSCEPCYSWNLFHAWQLGDRARFLEGMYSVFAGSVSRKTMISCETRGGITGTVFSAPLALYAARLAVIDDAVQDGELHLLRLAPPAWLAPGAECRFENVPTLYGPVSLRVKRTANGRRLDISFTAKWRVQARVCLHVPSTEGVRTVTLDGRALKARPGTVAVIGESECCH